MRERENDGQLIRHTEDRGRNWRILLQNKLHLWHESICCMCSYRDWFIIEKFKVIFAEFLHSCFGWLSHWCFCSKSNLISGSARLKHFKKGLSFIMNHLIFKLSSHSVSTCVSFCLSACLGIHSCSVGNGGCEHFCVQQTAGHLQCRCRLGYRLDGDGKHCKCEYDHTDVQLHDFLMNITYLW